MLLYLSQITSPTLGHPNYRSNSITNSRRLHPGILRFRCKLRTDKDGGSHRLMPKSDTKKKVVVLGVASPVLEENGSNKNGGMIGSENPFWVLSQRMSKRVLAVLSNLPLAIGEMFTIAALMALGTAIDQGEAPDYYFQKYPEENPVLGFLSWRWILTLGFDHMFSSPVFLGMLVLLAVSLMACTYTTQIPLVKVARRWSFKQSADSI